MYCVTVCSSKLSNNVREMRKERAILANWNSPNLETNSISQPVRWIESLTQEGAVTLKLHW